MVFKRPFILSVVNTKGGSGKSTLVMQLAFSFVRLLGFRVLIIDVDDQATCLTYFSRILDEEKIEAIYLPEEALKKSKVSSLGQGYDVVIIDGKGSFDNKQAHKNNKLAKKTIMSADFTIVPVVPAFIDMMAFTDFHEQVLEPVFDEGQVLLGVLFSKVDSSASCKNYIAEYRNKKRISCFKNSFPDRSPIKNSIGKGKAVFENKPYDKRSSFLFLELFKEILEATEINSKSIKLEEAYNKAKGATKNGKKRIPEPRKERDQASKKTR